MILFCSLILADPSTLDSIPMRQVALLLQPSDR